MLVAFISLEHTGKSVNNMFSNGEAKFIQFIYLGIIYIFHHILDNLKFCRTLMVVGHCGVLQTSDIRKGIYIVGFTFGSYALRYTMYLPEINF